MASLDELERQCLNCRWWFKENFVGHVLDCKGWYRDKHIWMRTDKRHGWNIPYPPYETHVARSKPEMPARAAKSLKV